MKRTILFIVWLIFLLWNTSYSQTAVRTESASGKYVYITAATDGDTIFTISTTEPSGTAIRNFGSRGYIVGVLIGEPVASDTIIVKNAASTVATIVQPASGISPQYYPLGVMMDSSCIVIQKKASKTTFIYRLRF